MRRIISEMSDNIHNIHSNDFWQNSKTHKSQLRLGCISSSCTCYYVAAEDLFFVFHFKLFVNIVIKVCIHDKKKYKKNSKNESSEKICDENVINQLLTRAFFFLLLFITIISCRHTIETSTVTVSIITA